jgi:hypothetical protein
MAYGLGSGCRECGSGLFPGDGKCPACYGSGRNVHLNSERQFCEKCGGSGVCPGCGGDGRAHFEPPSGPTFGQLLR